MHLVRAKMHNFLVLTGEILTLVALNEKFLKANFVLMANL